MDCIVEHKYGFKRGVRQIPNTTNLFCPAHEWQSFRLCSAAALANSPQAQYKAVATHAYGQKRNLERPLFVHSKRRHFEESPRRNRPNQIDNLNQLWGLTCVRYV